MAQSEKALTLSQLRTALGEVLPECPTSRTLYRRLMRWMSRIAPVIPTKRSTRREHRQSVLDGGSVAVGGDRKSGFLVPLWHQDARWMRIEFPDIPAELVVLLAGT